MAKRTLTVWMTASAGVLALSLAACGKPEGTAQSTASGATDGAATETVATAPPVGPVPSAVAPAETPAVAATTPAPSPAATAAPTAKAAALPAAPAVKPAATPSSPTPAAKAPASNPPAATRTADNGEFVDAPGKSVVQQNCTSCHAAGQVTAQHKTEAQWRDTVEQMIGYGAPVSDAEFPQIVSYLSKNYGR